MADDIREFEAGVAEIQVEGDGNGLQNFVAIQDVPPQKTLFISVVGEVLVGNPGVDAELTYAIPQGFVGSTLLLRVVLRQRPGMWPQVLVWKPVNYHRMILAHGQYSHVQIDGPRGGVTVEVVDR